MHADDAVIDLAATAQPLATDANGLIAALGRARFVDAADCEGMPMRLRHDALALVAHAVFIPLDRFQQTL
jgi:hypothetical protein